MKCFALLLSFASLGLSADFRTGQAARLVIGQNTFTAQQDQPSTGDAVTVLGGVSGLALAANTLIVVDGNRINAGPINNRVLLYRNLSSKLPPPTAELAEADGNRCPLCVGVADVVVGQPNFATTGINLTQSGLRTPVAASSDGTKLAIADTENNRILIWNTLPQTSGVPADVVVGQADFKSNKTGTSATLLKGPQGVWLTGGKMYIADTQNNRILIWNSIPTANNAPADVVIGQTGFNSAPAVDLTKANLTATANNLFAPVSVTTDGNRMLVADLGHNRVLVWNSIPTSNNAAADLAIGQIDLTSGAANNSSKLCAATDQKDTAGNPIYPIRCAGTLEFPRFALSDGKRLFIADGGNDRVLVFDTIPTTSGKAADSILGQVDDAQNQTSDPSQIASTNAIRTPSSLAWDGTNLFVSDPFNRRVLVFSLGEQLVDQNSVRNAASREIYALSTVTLAGKPKENDEVTVNISGTDYKYKQKANDTFANVIQQLVTTINDANTDLVAIPNTLLNTILLRARKAGDAGSAVAVTTNVSANADTTISNLGATTLLGNASKIAPGTIVSLKGTNLSDQVASAPANATKLPTELGGVQVYIDGIHAPLFYVSPEQINVQIPYEVQDATSISAYARIRRKNGDITATTAVAIPIIPENPGIFAANDGDEPRQGIFYHASSFGSVLVSVDGAIAAGEIATLTIDDRNYSYTVKTGDTLNVVRLALIDAINANPDERLTATAANAFTRIILRAKVTGSEGNDIPVKATATTSAGATGASLIVTALRDKTCCASTEGAPVTGDNPAIPGETLYFYATGLGLVTPDDARRALVTGQAYDGPAANDPNSSVYANVGGKTANIVSAGAQPGTIGIYKVVIELNGDLPTDDFAQAYIAQGYQVSNIVTLAIQGTAAAQ